MWGYYKALTFLFVFKLCRSDFPDRIGIIGGNDADIANYPYMLDLRIDASVGFICGAVLISPEWALTSARCGIAVSGNSGAYFTADSSIDGAGVRIDYTNITLHPDFDIFTYDNDLALMSLRTPIKCTICRPIRLGLSLPDDDELLTVLGWGVNNTAGTQSQILQEVALPVANYTACKDKYIGAGYNVTDNMFCLGYKNITYKSACVTDEGGPAVYNETLVGIISFAYFCSRDFFTYTITTRIDHYLEWIASITNIE